MGATLLILTQQTDSIFASPPLIQWLGERSYSLYLWHWPLVVSLYLAGLSQEWSWVLSAIAVSLLLAPFSYRWIEAPTRQYLAHKSLRKQLISIAVITIIILASAVSVKNHDFSRNLPQRIEIANHESLNKDPRKSECFDFSKEQGLPSCVYGSKNVGAILVGDSHAASVATAFGKAANHFNKGVTLLAYTGCHPLTGAKPVKQEEDVSQLSCSERHKHTKLKISKFDKEIPAVIVTRLNMAIWGRNESLSSNNPKCIFLKYIQTVTIKSFRKNSKQPINLGFAILQKSALFT